MFVPAYVVAMVVSYGIDKLLKRRMPGFLRLIFVLVVGLLLARPLAFLFIWIFCRDNCDL